MLFDFGNLAAMIQPDPNRGANCPETFYTYDADDELVEEIDPAGPASSPNRVEQITAYQYDDLGREKAVSLLAGTITLSNPNFHVKWAAATIVQTALVFGVRSSPRVGAKIDLRTLPTPEPVHAWEPAALPFARRELDRITSATSTDYLFLRRNS